VVSERGHLVIGFSDGSEQPELGTTLDNVLGFRPRQPLTIVGNADWTDRQEQVETFYRIRPTWGRGKIGDPNDRYYRVEFAADVPSFSGYALQSVPEGLVGQPFWPRAAARIVDYILVNFVLARMAGALFRFVLTTAAGGRRLSGFWSGSRSIGYRCSLLACAARLPITPFALAFTEAL